MPIPSTMADLSLTAANNSPQGTDPIGNTLDDYLRSIQAILRSTNALAPASIASASTTDIGSAAAESVEITGTTTITSFGTAPAGIRRELRFTGSLTIVHSSSIQLPGATNWQTAPGDVLTFRSLGSGQWIMTGHQSLDASRLTGTLDPARVPQGAVTQHQAALVINESQITDGTILARIAANEAITGTWTFENAPNFNSGGASIKLKPGTADHVYMELYARSATPNARSAYIGFGNTASTVLDISVDINGGIIRLQTNNGPILLNGTSVLVNGSAVWTAANDGSGSGLDADLLDGQHASAFAALAEPETISGTWTFSTRPRSSNAGGFLSHASPANTGGSVTVSTSAASGTPADGDIWIQYS